MFNLSSSILLAKSESQRPFGVRSCSHLNFIMCTITSCLKLIYKRPLKKIESSELRFFFLIIIFNTLQSCLCLILSSQTKGHVNIDCKANLINPSEWGRLLFTDSTGFLHDLIRSRDQLSVNTKTVQFCQYKLKERIKIRLPENFLSCISKVAIATAAESWKCLLEVFAIQSRLHCFPYKSL